MKRVIMFVLLLYKCYKWHSVMHNGWTIRYSGINEGLDNLKKNVCLWKKVSEIETVDEEKRIYNANKQRE